jgi:uncharacterized short protein YbdD (DUF466 family)
MPDAHTPVQTEEEFHRARTRRSTAAAVAAATLGIGVPAFAGPVAHAEELAPDLVVSTLPAASSPTRARRPRTASPSGSG